MSDRPSVGLSDLVRVFGERWLATGTSKQKRSNLVSQIEERGFEFSVRDVESNSGESPASQHSVFATKEKTEVSELFPKTPPWRKPLQMQWQWDVEGVVETALSLPNRGLAEWDASFANGQSPQEYIDHYQSWGANPAARSGRQASCHQARPDVFLNTDWVSILKQLRYKAKHDAWDKAIETLAKREPLLSIPSHEHDSFASSLVVLFDLRGEFGFTHAQDLSPIIKCLNKGTGFKQIHCAVWSDNDPSLATVLERLSHLRLEGSILLVFSGFRAEESHEEMWSSTAAWSKLKHQSKKYVEVNWGGIADPPPQLALDKALRMLNHACACVPLLNGALVRAIRLALFPWSSSELEHQFARQSDLLHGAQGLFIWKRGKAREIREQSHSTVGFAAETVSALMRVVETEMSFWPSALKHEAIVNFAELIESTQLLAKNEAELLAIAQKGLALFSGAHDAIASSAGGWKNRTVSSVMQQQNAEVWRDRLSDSQVVLRDTLAKLAYVGGRLEHQQILYPDAQAQDSVEAEFNLDQLPLAKAYEVVQVGSDLVLRPFLSNGSSLKNGQRLRVVQLRGNRINVELIKGGGVVSKALEDSPIALSQLVQSNEDFQVATAWEQFRVSRATRPLGVRSFQRAETSADDGGSPYGLGLQFFGPAWFESNPKNTFVPNVAWRFALPSIQFHFFSPAQAEAAPLLYWGVDEYGAVFSVSLQTLMGKTNVDTDLEIRFRYIEPGTFHMGSTPEEVALIKDENLRELATRHELPQHTVHITEGFWMAETPITVGQWNAVMSDKKKGESDHPVTSVSWDDAAQFMHRIQKQLPQDFAMTFPTEAQWEHACRAGTSSAYSWGNDADLSKMNVSENSKSTTPVKRHQPNDWGLYDMHGNVWEWCLDEGLRSYKAGDERNPVSKGKSDASAIRGGSWDLSADYARAAFRHGSPRDDDWLSRGFRPVLRSLQGLARQEAGSPEAERGEPPSDGPPMKSALRRLLGRKN